MNKLIFTAILSGFAGLYAMGQNEIRLMDMDLNKSYQTYGGTVKGKSVTNEPASIQGKTYDDVIGVQAKSHIKIDLHKNASRFQAQVGIADSHIDYTDKSLTVIPFVDGTKMYFDTRKNAKTFVGLEGKDGKVHPGSVLFILKGDDKELYNSGIVKLGDAPKTIDIPLNGIKILDLIVEPTDDGPSGDHALWITPQIEYMEIIPSIISTSYQGKGPEVSSGTEKKLLDKIKRLPQQGLPLENTSFDWLLQPSRSKAGIYATPDGKSILLSNGMVARMFRVLPNLSTLDIFNRMTGESMLRAVSSEGSLTIDGKRWELGGLAGQPLHPPGRAVAVGQGDLPAVHRAGGNAEGHNGAAAPHHIIFAGGKMPVLRFLQADVTGSLQAATGGIRPVPGAGAFVKKGAEVLYQFSM